MGEDAAAKFLRAKGMKILARNFRSGKNEIDIVCRDAAALVFVEVKTRKSGAAVNGFYAAVAKGKKAAVRAAAKDYLREMKISPKTLRFDAVEVAYDPEKLKPERVSHYQNVY